MSPHQVVCLSVFGFLSSPVRPTVSFPHSCCLSLLSGYFMSVCLSASFSDVCLCLCFCLFATSYVSLPALLFCTPMSACLFIYYNSMFLLVAWLVILSGFHALTGRWIRTVHMSKEPSQPRNEPRGGYFRLIAPEDLYF